MGYRLGVPTLLLFLFTGMLFGSDGLGLEFNSHEDAQLIGMLSLSVILFSGGMDTKRLDIGLTLPMSMLLAATVSSADSASVFNLLRTQRIGLKHRLRPLLELESGSNAPMAYVLTVALVDMIVTAGEFSGMALATKIIGQLAVGGLLAYLHYKKRFKQL